MASSSANPVEKKDPHVSNTMCHLKPDGTFNDVTVFKVGRQQSWLESHAFGQSVQWCGMI
jgi:hypothetical protein